MKPHWQPVGLQPDHADYPLFDLERVLEQTIPTNQSS
jgi:hypothetical protein